LITKSSEKRHLKEGRRAFAKVDSMTFEGRYFAFSGEFLIDRIESVVVQYLGRLTEIFGKVVV